MKKHVPPPSAHANPAGADRPRIMPRAARSLELGIITGIASLFLLAKPAFAFIPHQDSSTTPGNPPSDFVLGPYDQIAVIVGEFQDQFANKTFRIDGQGDVSLPLVGRIHATGLTLHAFEDSIREHLSPILKHPDVVVNITDFTSQSVSVLGAVKTPGVHKLIGKNNLFDALSLSGGLTETAGTTIKLTREARWGPIPWPTATVDPVSKISTAIVHVKEISQAGADSFTVMPGDTIFVPKADLVYAVGSVVKPGSFPIGEKETLSALQVVSLAGGLPKTAAGDKAKILRAVPGSTARTEIPVNIKKLMAGKTTDIQLLPEDILFIPNSDAKSVGFRTIDAIVNAASGLAVYGARF
jgi:polysaccharide export outer membrane protein